LADRLRPRPERIPIELALDPIELAIEQAVPCGPDPE
jgi:hypothetical protein